MYLYVYARFNINQYSSRPTTLRGECSCNIHADDTFRAMEYMQKPQLRAASKFRAPDSLCYSPLLGMLFVVCLIK